MEPTFPMAAERRMHPRVRLTLPVQLSPEHEPGRSCAGMTYDVSATGLQVITDTSLDRLSPLVVTFQLPGESSVRQIRARIVKALRNELGSGVRLGVEFVDLSGEEQGRVDASLRHSDLRSLLQRAAELHASDVHLSANHPPLVRVNRQLKPLRPDVLEGGVLKDMIYSVLDPRQREAFERDLQLNFSLSAGHGLRYRVNVHTQRGHVEAAFRRIEPRVRTFAELHLPRAAQELTDLRDGLILVTGPAGSGKTTTVAAMIDAINATRAAVVIALENPIEYVHEYKKSVIKQREIGLDVQSFPVGMREAMRQDPDVIVVGEIRDADTMRTALDAAETGHLVLATFSAGDALQSLSRAIHFFHESGQQDVRFQLANCLRAVVCQRLLPRTDGKGLAVATEILTNVPAVAHLIRLGNLEQILSVMQTGQRHGMHTLDHSLQRLFHERQISVDTLQQHAPAAHRMIGAG